jgi:hypothetical protein
MKGGDCRTPVVVVPAQLPQPLNNRHRLKPCTGRGRETRRFVSTRLYPHLAISLCASHSDVVFKLNVRVGVSSCKFLSRPLELYLSSSFL